MTESLFQAALAIPPAGRAAFLDDACAGQPELRAAVAALLAAREASGTIPNKASGELVPTIDSGPVEAASAATGEFITAERDDDSEFTPESNDASHAITRLPMTAITANYLPAIERGAVIAGRYTLIEQIGEGGMGDVWVAKQAQPVKRKVALKLIKAGMDSKAVVNRFEQERQALAMMDHPNIARVLDGGLTADRRPFFVMELVNGLPLTKFCDDAKLTTRERLELFVSICQAVQHAHQKGIVHRDLKPSNILVTLYDGKPVPKVIDFGVAKATGGKLTDESLSTQFGAVVGTLEYMSPEQAGFSGIDIDTRADIYSLGVILYELLTGLRPIDFRRLQEAATIEVIRIIQEEEPSKPSTRLSTDEALPTLAALRQTEPKRLTALLRGELDWVVMKCLEKQRERRYETASALARDIQRYLADEPVEARPPSAGYRLGKFLRRNKGPVLAASVVALALVGGIIGTSWQAMRAENARQAEAKRAEGERSAKLDAERARAREAVRADGERLAKEKEAEARSKAEDAEKHARESHADALAFARFLAIDILASARPKGQRGGLGVEVTVKQALAEAVAKIPERFQERPIAEALARQELGVTFRLLGDMDAAEEQLRLALALRLRVLPTGDPETLNTQNSLAVLLGDHGKLEEAIPLFEDTLKLRKISLGPNHAHTLSTMGNLANAYRAAGRTPEALPLFEEAVQRLTEIHGPDHPDTLIAMNNMALAYGGAGRLNEKLAILEKYVNLSKTRFGDDHPETLTGMNNLAVAYWETSNPAQAIPLLEKTVELRMANVGPDHPHTLSSLASLAFMYTRFIVGPEFKPHYIKHLPELRHKLSSDGPMWLAVLTATANQLLSDQNYEGAEPLLRDSLTIREEKEAGNWTTFYTKSLLGAALAGQKKYADAQPLLLGGYEGMKAREAAIPPSAKIRLTEALVRLVQLYEAWEKPGEADKWRKELEAHKSGQATQP